MKDSTRGPWSGGSSAGGADAGAPRVDSWLANPSTPAEAELRQALDQAAARGADEVALRRVWARLAEVPALVPSHDLEREQALQQFDQARAGRGRWPWIVAASLAGATATLALMLIETKSEFRAERSAPSGPVPALATSNGSGNGSEDQQSTIVAPATVRTGFGETLRLSLRGGTQVTVTSESTLVLDQNERPTVSDGEVQFHVPHQVPGQTFAVSAGVYRVVVVGTRFRVRVNQTNAAVGVDEGVVEIWTDHRVARVSAGESWVSPTVAIRPGAAHARADVRTASSDPAGVRAARPAVGRAARAAAAARLAGASPPAGHTARSELALGTPSGAFSASGPSAGSYRGMGAVAPAAPGSRDAVPTTGNTTGNSSADGAPALSPVPGPVDNTPLAVQARAARAAGDSRRALGLYRALVRKGGAAGENAEYEIGRLLRDGLHQPREAVATWRQYRAQHPRGLLRAEADLSIIETLVSTGDKTAAVAEASDFIGRYPDSERRAEIARLAGDLLRDRGQYAEAISAYDAALGSAHGRRDIADGASFHRALCLMRAEPGAGADALKGYLAAFPGGRFRVEAQRLLGGLESVRSTSLSNR